PAATSPSPFVLYAVAREPGAADVRAWPRGIGRLAFPSPLTDPGGPLPVVLVNNVPNPQAIPRLGAPRFVRGPPPAVAAARPRPGRGRERPWRAPGDGRVHAAGRRDRSGKLGVPRERDQRDRPPDPLAPARHPDEVLDLRDGEDPGDERPVAIAERRARLVDR